MPASEIDDIFSGKIPKVLVFGDNSSARCRGKRQGKAVPEAAPSSSSSSLKKTKKRKQREGDAALDGPDASSSQLRKLNQKKNKLCAVDDGNADAEGGGVKVGVKSTLRVVETVRDPSAGMNLSLAPSTRPKFKPATKKTLSARLGAKKGTDRDEDRIMDSRGLGPRKKTDEGFLVYKEAELGIKDEGGDTPLCPFDCDCCF
ncbi:hypothetical protein EW145_g3141 [Phellinidium pouzarii]|uniref:DUF1764 domain-containing protein n=1 Tax=Phellinidium pouzarii TaxID=167371 RepID=A0A4S4L8M1_9AGAM|nr:hypothetical protein EW145_g3141 [Phellinidium pouzarii]